MTASKEKNSKDADRLSFFAKFCFAIAGLPYQMYFCAISVFTTVFLLEVAKIPPNQTTYILFVSRIIDAITDPLYGFFINKTKPTKYGRLRPWIIVSMPLTALAYLMMWFAPEGFSVQQLFVWFLIWHSLFFTFITGFRIPHTSLTMFLCTSQSQRQSATVYRMGLEMLGILLALAVQGPFASPGSSCSNVTITTTSLTSTSLAMSNFTTTLPLVSSMMTTTSIVDDESVVKQEEDAWTRHKFVIIAAVLTLIFIVCNLLLIFFVKERTGIFKIFSILYKYFFNVLKLI